LDESPGGRLHVTLHAKVPPGTSLAHAHSLSDRLEAAVGSELGPGVRVDSHLEPLEPTATGEDVTADRADLVRDVTRLAESEPEVRDCHEVVVTHTGGGLSLVAHVRAPGALELDAIHAASERIEKAIHAEHPEIGSVLIHFEPA
ncbi:MAG: cation transporter dimerization domain-containing protein, partial [Actinomycetota bacterium]